jgi:electron transport complex protein RnfB
VKDAAPGPPNSQPEKSLASRILDALPQTQCTRCGYPDCAAYADAVASNLAAINQCPPGGAEGVQRLARITGCPELPLNRANGIEGQRAVAIIDEEWCIGCTLCIKACPTDAIIGSNKMMHTVIEPYCTGCELCIPVCPVDCISLENVTGERTGWAAWSQAEAETARNRYEIHSFRESKTEAFGTKAPSNMVKKPSLLVPNVPARPEYQPEVADKKRAVIEAALARARAARGPKS